MPWNTIRPTVPLQRPVALTTNVRLVLLFCRWLSGEAKKKNFIKTNF